MYVWVWEVRIGEVEGHGVVKIETTVLEQQRKLKKKEWNALEKEGKEKNTLLWMQIQKEKEVEEQKAIYV